MTLFYVKVPMVTSEYNLDAGGAKSLQPPTTPAGSLVPRFSSASGPASPRQPAPGPQPRAVAPAESRQAGESRWSSASSRVFLAGFGLSLLLLIIEYLTAGGFPGWFILVPSNPTTLLGAFVGHKVEAAVGARWSDEAFFATLVVESALWWYMVGVLVVVVRRRRAHQR